MYTSHNLCCIYYTLYQICLKIIIEFSYTDVQKRTDIMYQFGTSGFMSAKYTGREHKQFYVRVRVCLSE